MKHYKRIALLYAATALVATLVAYWICAGTYYRTIFGASTREPLAALYYNSLGESLGAGLGAVAVILLLGLLILRGFWKRLGSGLREMDNEIANLFESSQDALIDCDMRGRVIRANPMAFLIAGLEPNELAGRPIGDVLRFASGQRADAFGWPPVLDPSYIGGGEMQMSMVRTDGSLAPVSCMLTNYSRDGVSFVRLDLDDLSEKLSLERALRQRDQSLALLSAASFEGLAITDGEHIIEGNHALCRTFGYEKGQLVGLGLEQLFALESREILRQRLTAPREGTFELRAQNADGGHFQCLVSLKTIPFGNSMVVAAALRDVTESRQAERVIQQYQRREAELCAIQKTAATCAHEINNPLTGLLATIQMLLEEVRDGEHQAMLEDSLQCTQRIREVLGKLEQLTNPKYRQYNNTTQIIDLRTAEPALAAKVNQA